MKIYRVLPDVNRFQSMTPEDAQIWNSDRLTFDGLPKKKDWLPPDLFVLHPKLKKGDFFHLCPGTLVLNEGAIEILLEYLEMSGELLPVRCEGEEYTVINVTECINVLNRAETDWVYGSSTGKRIRIRNYAFYADRLTETPLFKIPETARGEILTATGLKDQEDEFKFNVESRGLKGLLFEKIWSSYGKESTGEVG